MSKRGRAPGSREIVAAAEGLPSPVLAYPELEQHGRFGNQLWQVASTVGLARLNGAEPRFPEAWSYRPILSCPDAWFDDEALPGAMTSPEIAAKAIGSWPATYLQHLPFIAPAEDELRAAFAPSPEARVILSGHAAATGFGETTWPRGAIHVRRGDTVNNPAGTLNPIDAAWYRRAVKWLRMPTSTAGCASVTAFTDDAEWVREHLGDVVDVVVSGPQRPPRQDGGYEETGPVDWLDLYLMSTVDALVTSNSSYSWWAAWLSRASRVGYPQPWFGPVMAPRHRRNRFIPSSWTALPGATPQR